jgi:hypothetical protein
MTRVVLALLALLVLACSSAAAQGRQRCNLIRTDNTTLTQQQTPSGQSNIFVGGGVRISCPSSDLRLSSDSLESYGDHGRFFLFGNVHYDEPRLSLTSDYLTYYQAEERIIANGNVNARLPSGSTMRGPYAEYYRAIPVTRPATRLYANGRPAFTIVQRDSAGNPGEPLRVLANNVTMIGDSLVFAGGAVQATRPEVEARGDSMTLDSEAEYMVMMRDPVIEGRGERPFTLMGERIELTSTNRKLSRVLALRRGRARSQDMTLTSDTIDLRFANDLLQRSVAWGPSRAVASSPTQQLVADSLDVRMPDQRIREVFAVRNAAAYGRPDSTRFRADTTDWLRGDTIIARFDSTVTDTARNTTRLRELEAMGSARAYYHLAPADTSAGRPAINYVTGREIVISFRNQQVATVTVVNQAAGIYLEPRPDSTAAPVAPAATRPASTPPVRRP